VRAHLQDPRHHPRLLSAADVWNVFSFIAFAYFLGWQEAGLPDGLFSKQKFQLG
jgi:hypothetical protein